MVANADRLRVEVAYANPRRQIVIALHVATGTTAEAAVRASGILQSFPEICLERAELGVFGRRVPHDWVLAPGDRVEIYRALRIDPKEARRRRAATATKRRPGGHGGAD